MAGGRPTTWSEELEQQAWDYANGGWEAHHAIPSVVGLCSVINRSRKVVYDWAGDERYQFGDILDTINTNQQIVTFDRSLKGEYNASIAKLLLGKHGYHDKQDQTVSGPEGGPIEQKWTVELKNANDSDTE